MPTFEQKSVLPISPEDVFAWHERRGALERLVPPWEKTEVVEPPTSLEPGTRVVLKMWRGVLPITWVARHTSMERGRSFHDEQESGPFASWKHEHLFLPASEGCELVDRIEYELPLGAVANAVAGSSVADDLSRAFRFRHKRTKRDLKRHRRFKQHGTKRFVIAGATGMVGDALVAFLETGGHEVIRLTRGAPRRPTDSRWDPARGQIDASVIDGADVVVNLAGENVAGSRWTADRKRAIEESRIQATGLIARTIASATKKPEVFISASAIGFYGDGQERELDETSPSGDGFLAEVCRNWEAETMPAQDAGVRTVHARFGVILAAQGGALAKMLGPFRLGMGGPIGGGKQWMSFVDLDDAIGALHQAAFDVALVGPMNVVSPTPVRNADFVRALGHALHRPAIVPLPAFAVKTAMGDMGREMLLFSQRVMPDKLEAAGFRFAHRDVESSFGEQLGSDLDRGHTSG
jgi:uncharacterized protein (TIGR01777 family)